MPLRCRRRSRLVIDTIFVGVVCLLVQGGLLERAWSQGEPPAADAPATDEAAPGPEVPGAPAADAPAPPAPDAPASDAAPAPTTAAGAADDVVAGLRDDLLALSLPPGTSLARVVDDARGTVFTIGLPAAGADESAAPVIEMYVLDLEQHGVSATDAKAANKKISDLVSGFLGIERVLGLKATGRTVLALNGCDAASHVYKDDEHEVRLAACAHPSVRRLYIWRLELLPSVEADAREPLVRAFESLLVEGMDLLDPTTGLPLVRAAATTPSPKPATPGSPSGTATPTPTPPAKP